MSQNETNSSNSLIFFRKFGCNGAGRLVSGTRAVKTGVHGCFLIRFFFPVNRGRVLSALYGSTFSPVRKLCRTCLRNCSAMGVNV